MKHLPNLFYTALAATAVLAIAGAIPLRAWAVMGVGLATAVLWGRYWRFAPWVGDVGLFLFYANLAYAIVLGIGEGWVLAGGISALVAWDLAHFDQRLASQALVQNKAELWRGHWRPLAAVVLLSLALGGFALLVPLGLTFWPALGTALAALLLINYIAQQVSG
jgi:hypothetical protein